MGKGCKRRPQFVSDAEFAENWERIFDREVFTRPFCNPCVVEPNPDKPWNEVWDEAFVKAVHYLDKLKRQEQADGE